MSDKGTGKRDADTRHGSNGHGVKVDEKSAKLRQKGGTHGEVVAAQPSSAGHVTSKHRRSVKGP
jgi:hypothetical protein